MKLSEKVRQQVESSPEIIGKLSGATGRSFQTIKRWVDSNDEMLTMAKCMSVICEELGMTQDEILEPEMKS
jgi:hypothetical protein